MDVLRRNTDYALRMMVHLALQSGGEPVSTRQLAETGDISYPLACKLMQMLNKAKLVKSFMGPAGGFGLAREPEQINLLDMIAAIQGPLALNRCLVDISACQRAKGCPVSKKLQNLQQHINEYLADVTLAELVSGDD